MKIIKIRLHIDDGSMGGGGPIPHMDSTSQDEFWDIIVENYFAPERNHIFHYTCFGHVDDGYHAGWGSRRGYYFWISDDMLDEGYDSDCNWRSHNTKQASLFMHELGHNLDLGDRGDKHTAMFTPPKGGNKQFWKKDYLSDEWPFLVLDPAIPPL